MDGGGCGRRSKEEDAGGRGPSASAQALGFAGDAGMLLLLIYARAAVRIRIRIRPCLVHPQLLTLTLRKKKIPRHIKLTVHEVLNVDEIKN